MSHIAVITARGGSKRVPGKNYKEFCGKPIIAYSIQAALDSGLYDEVMVSTDSEIIADVARQYGAAVPFMRSAETANDFATTHDVLMEVVAEYQKRGRTFDLLTCLYPCAPFITAKKLQDATAMLLQEQADMIFPVVPFEFPPQRALTLRDGCLQFWQPGDYNARSQDLEPLYHDCGQFYVWQMSSLLANKRDHWIPLIVPETEAQDVDTPADWALAEIKYRAFIEQVV